MRFNDLLALISSSFLYALPYFFVFLIVATKTDTHGSLIICLIGIKL